jgi:hypothetical protein
VYRIAEIIENDAAPSIVGEVSFHPSGSYFAATYEQINEVRIYDSGNRKLLQVLRNPDCQFDGPHGVLFSEKYLLISNKHGLRQPGTINVYRNSDAITEPIQVLQSPFDHLREPHSMALRDGRLVVTYCENLTSTGVIVSYGFDEDTGKITGLLDKTESWFLKFGDAKGICFNNDGTKILVTFQSGKYLPFVRELSYRSITKFIRRLIAKRQKNKPTKNGVAVFSISAQGKLAHSPEHVVVRSKFCRLENIDIFEGTCVITDVVNHSSFLYDLNQDPKFSNPVQTITLGKAAPHGAKFSPDGKLLIISCLGLEIVRQRIGFSSWASPREDKIFVFERAAPAPR